MIGELLIENNTLRCRLKAAKEQIAQFESGEKYLRMKTEYREMLRHEEAKIRRLEQELADAHARNVTIRNSWSEIFDDLEKEHAIEIKKKEAEIGHLRERIIEVERQRDNALDKIREERLLRYQAQTELEEEKGRNMKLTAQVNRDFENSSIPSSMQGAGRKKIPNSRVKSGRKRGGQIGHKGHNLKRKKPTRTIMLEDPEEYKDPLKYQLTKEVTVRQVTSLHLTVEVTEYQARVFRNRETGGRVHARFPDGCISDVNYDGSVKAFAFLLNDECNVSAGKIRRFMSEITDGAISMSESTIIGLSEAFSSRTEDEKKRMIKKLMVSPVMNADFTNANVDGESRQTLILASPVNGTVMYVAREAKGHKGVAGTPLAGYVGCVVHDHDVTFYSYGMKHQECTQHNLRYLVGSIENEPGLTWNRKMHALFIEMIHYKNSLDHGEEPDPVIVADLEERYDEILVIAEKEYEYDPPNDYYREGYNLFLRLREYRISELRFLHDKWVPSNNSLAERSARVFKRKQKQSMVFRSDDNHEYICDCLGILNELRLSGNNLYNEVSLIFNRDRYRKRRKQAREPADAGE